MDLRSFEELLSWVDPFIQKSSLKVTIGTSYRISPTTMRRIIWGSCRAIWYVLNKKGFTKAPTSKKERLDIAAEFDNKWNFLHSLGAKDGEHIII